MRCRARTSSSVRDRLRAPLRSHDNLRRVGPLDWAPRRAARRARLAIGGIPEACQPLGDSSFRRRGTHKVVVLVRGRAQDPDARASRCRASCFDLQSHQAPHGVSLLGTILAGQIRQNRALPFRPTPAHPRQLKGGFGLAGSRLRHQKGSLTVALRAKRRQSLRIEGGQLSEADRCRAARSCLSPLVQDLGVERMGETRDGPAGQCRF